MVEVTDSGFTPENIADAEWLWTNLPTFPRNWSTLPTHEKALIVHTAIRHREAAAKAERDRIVAWLREMGSIRGGVADAIEALEHLEEKQP